MAVLSRQSLWVAVLLLLPSLVYAQLLITVEDILGEDDGLQLGTSFSYFNRQSDVNFLGLSENEDLLGLGFSLRYGVVPDTDISFFASASYIEGRGLAGGERFSYSEYRGELVGFSISHRISPDAETPALIVFGRIGLLERSSRLDADVEYGAGATRCKLTGNLGASIKPPPHCSLALATTSTRMHRFTFRGTCQ